MVDRVAIEVNDLMKNNDSDDTQKTLIASTRKLQLLAKHCEFLQKPLTLGMFVPTDEDGNVLEEPDFFSGDYDDNGFGDVDKYQYKLDSKQYQQAKDRVLFEGFEIFDRSLNLDNNLFFSVGYLHNYNIEYLTTLKTKPTLTPTGLKILN